MEQLNIGLLGYWLIEMPNEIHLKRIGDFSIRKMNSYPKDMWECNFNGLPIACSKEKAFEVLEAVKTKEQIFTFSQEECSADEKTVTVSYDQIEKSEAQMAKVREY